MAKATHALDPWASEQS